MTEKNIIEIGKEWDPYPFHVDADAAKNTDYGALVASTVQLFAITVKLSHTATEVAAAIASLGMTDMKNHAPAYVDDTLEGHITYLGKRISKSKHNAGIMTAKSELINQDGKVLFSYRTTGLYKMRG